MTRDYLKTIDVFGSDVKMRIDNQESVKTSFGGLLTLIICVLCVVVAWVLGNDVVFREKPNSFTESVYNSTKQRVVLDKYNYPMTFVLKDVASNKVNNASLFSLLVQQRRIVNFANGSSLSTTNIFPLVNCTLNHFPNVKDKSLQNVLLPNMCIDNQNLTLQGYWGDEVIEYVNLFVNMCDYEKTPEKCGTKEEIFNFITNKQIQVGIYTVENSVTVSNYSYPLNQFVANPFKFLYTSVNKYVNYLVNQNFLKTDSGFFTEDFDQKDFYTMKELVTDMAAIPSTKRLITIGFYMNSEITIYHRAYIKITDIFGSMGGILKLLLIFFNLLTIPFSKIQKNILLNDSLNSNNNLEENNKQNKIFTSVFTKKKATSNLNIETNLITSQIPVAQKSVRSFNKTILSSKGMLSNNNAINFPKKNLNKTEIIKNIGQTGVYSIATVKFMNILKCKKLKSNKAEILREYSFYSRKIKKLLNINEIFKQLQQIEKLKNILLDNDIIEIFDINNKKQKELLEEDKNKINLLLNKRNKNETEIRLANFINRKLVK